MSNQLLKSIRTELQEAIASAPGTTITLEMKMHAEQYLSTARNEVIKAVEGLTADQLNFKSSPDRWSIGEILEHLGIVEESVVTRVMANFANAPAPALDRNAKEIENRILTQGPEAVEKWSAPSRIHPTGKIAKEVAILHIESFQGRAKVFLHEFPDLRGHVMPHMVFGPLDGFDWVILTAAHYERHLGQIDATKREGGFAEIG